MSHTQSSMFWHSSGKFYKQYLCSFVLQRMCGTSSARPQCTTTFPLTGTVSSSVCTLGMTIRNTSATWSSPSSCRYAGHTHTHTHQSWVFHVLTKTKLCLQSALWCHVLFFRSCSWNMHARRLPRRTKGRMVSSQPWTSVILWPPSDTTCSHPLWRRTSSRWVFACARRACWQ